MAIDWRVWYALLSLRDWDARLVCIVLSVNWNHSLIVYLFCSLSRVIVLSVMFYGRSSHSMKIYEKSGCKVGCNCFRTENELVNRPFLLFWLNLLDSHAFIRLMVLCSEQVHFSMLVELQPIRYLVNEERLVLSVTN